MGAIHASVLCTLTAQHTPCLPPEPCCFRTVIRWSKLLSRKQEWAWFVGFEEDINKTCV